MLGEHRIGLHATTGDGEQRDDQHSNQHNLAADDHHASGLVAPHQHTQDELDAVREDESGETD